MALMQSPSNTPDAIAQKTEFSPDAQNRINTVAKSAIAVLDKNLDAQNAIRGLFGKMIAENLRDPVSVWKIQNGLYEARDMRLEKADSADRLSLLEWFSRFMEKFTQWIAQMNRDVGLSNEANALKNGSDTKIAQVQATYNEIITSNHPTQTA